MALDAECCYADRYLSCVAFMLRVASKLYMLSVVMLSVVILNVVVPLKIPTSLLTQVKKLISHLETSCSVFDAKVIKTFSLRNLQFGAVS
jgi:hypothetical protein